MNENPYHGPMQPFPGLERWSRKARLPLSQIELHYYDTGGESKPAVLLLHGLGDEADTWRHVLPSIAADYRTIAPDLPGFGRSDKPDVKYTVPFFVDTLLELLDELGVSRAGVVGHSTGAIIAHHLALEHPGRVERLVLIGGSLVSRSQPLNLGLLTFLIPGLGERAYTKLRKDPQAAYRTLEGYYHRLSDLPQAYRDFLFQRVNERVWSDGQRKGFLATFRGLAGWLPGQQKGLAARLNGWPTPTQVLWGAEDQVNPVENARALAEMIPSAQVTIVPNAGHNLQQEQPVVVAQAIRAKV
jgi:pimeloyl-ACP methyl ester carboxylesterase